MRLWRTFCGDVSDVDLCPLSHVAKDHEDDEAREEAGTTVYHACNQGVPVMVNIINPINILVETDP